MKRAIMMSVVGAAACLLATGAQAQGQIIFCNYASQMVTAPVTYVGPTFGGYSDGRTIGQPFHAALVYSLDGGTMYTDAGITANFLFPSGTPLASGGGLFGHVGNIVTIPDYTSGRIDFIVLVYNGPSYAASTMMAVSGVVTVSMLSTPSNHLPVGGMFSDNPNVITPLKAFAVAAIPEPATLALGGLGLAALVLIRRKLG